MLNPKRLISQNLNEINISEGNLSVADIKNLINKEDPVILEIGANCGQTTIDFIENFPNALIHCFEPDPRCIRKFKAMINSKNVFLHEMAIGNIDGNITFNQSAGAESIDPEGWDHSGSIKAPKAHLEMYPWVRFDTKIVVQIMRLDSWAKLNNITNVDFIWADVQGAEEDLILGGNDTLKKTRFFYTEYYDNECYEGQLKLDQLYQLLNQYLIVRRYSNDVLLQNFFASNSLPQEILMNFFESANSSSSFNEYCYQYGATPEIIKMQLENLSKIHHEVAKSSERQRESTLKQKVSNYNVLENFSQPALNPHGNSASPKEIIFHILDDNSQEVSILDIGFGSGTLGEMIKSNPLTSHWNIDGVDGWEPNCLNLELFNRRIYRNVWHGLAQDIPLNQLTKYKIICLLDVIEHLDIETSKKLLRSLLNNLNKDSYLFISTPLWYYPQDHEQEGDLEEHLIGVPVSSMFALIPKMYAINHPLVGGFVLSRSSLDYIDFFQPTDNRNFSYEMGLKVLNTMGIDYKPGVLIKNKDT